MLSVLLVFIGNAGPGGLPDGGEGGEVDPEIENLLQNGYSSVRLTLPRSSTWPRWIAFGWIDDAPIRALNDQGAEKKMMFW